MNITTEATQRGGSVKTAKRLRRTGDPETAMEIVKRRPWKAAKRSGLRLERRGMQYWTIMPSGLELPSTDNEVHLWLMYLGLEKE